MRFEDGTLRRPSLAPSYNRFHFYKGRVALYALLQALGVGPADEIVVPVYTCPAVIEPVIGLRAKIVYCDIDPGTFGLAPQSLAAAFTNKTKAVIVQHTFGIPAFSSDLMNLLCQTEVAVLEDCCHVSLSSYKGRRLGDFGDAAFYSHDWGKPFAVGAGGITVVNSARLLEEVARLYVQFATTSLQDEALFIARSASVAVKRRIRSCLPVLAARLRSRLQIEPNCVPPAGCELGSEYGKRMPRLAKNRLDTVLNDMSSRASARRRAVERYERGFRDIGIGRFENPKECDVILWRYPIFALDKPTLLRRARREGVTLSDWGTIPVRSFIGMDCCGIPGKERFPVAEDIAQRLVTLGIEEWRDDAEIDRNLDFLRRMKGQGLV